MKAVLDKLELAFAAFGGFIGWFLGGFDGFLYALVVFVVMDYFTGVLAAGVKKEMPLVPMMIERMLLFPA